MNPTSPGPLKLNESIQALVRIPNGKGVRNRVLIKGHFRCYFINLLRFARGFLLQKHSFSFFKKRWSQNRATLRWATNLANNSFLLLPFVLIPHWKIQK